MLNKASRDVAASLRTQLASGAIWHTHVCLCLCCLSHALIYTQTATSATIATEDTRAEVARIAGLLANVGAEREARSVYSGWVKKRTETAARARRLLAEKEMDGKRWPLFVLYGPFVCVCMCGKFGLIVALVSGDGRSGTATGTMGSGHVRSA